MKKILIILTLIILLTSTTSCTIPSHTHDYSEKLQFDENNHWNKCTKCRFTINKVEHQFFAEDTIIEGNNISYNKLCICGYQTSETKEFNPQINSSEEWNNIFKSFIMTNFSLDISNIFGFDGTKIKLLVGENRIMSERVGDNPIYIIKSLDGKWKKYDYNETLNLYVIYSLDCTDEEFINGLEVYTLDFSLIDCFDKFTYNESTNRYVCNETIITSFKSSSYPTLNLFNLEILFVDGKVFSMKSDFSITGLENQIDNKFTLEYYNIDMTGVIVPDEVLENAKEYDEVLNNNK